MLLLIWHIIALQQIVLIVIMILPRIQVHGLILTFNQLMPLLGTASVDVVAADATIRRAVGPRRVLLSSMIPFLMN